MEQITHDRWISRQELADRYGLPVKTPAEWASKGTGPPYAKFGRHVRYRLSDVIAWEANSSLRITATQRDCVATAMTAIRWLTFNAPAELTPKFPEGRWAKG